MIYTLLNWIVNPYTIYSGYTGLHLNLWVMNSWFIINEQLTKILCYNFPIYPQIITGKTNKHSTHPKI